MRSNLPSRLPALGLARVLAGAGLLWLAVAGRAQIDPGGDTNMVACTPLETWSFYDSTNWTSDSGRSPVSFANLAFLNYGNGASLAVDSNLPAWLHYNVFEASGATNFTPDSGTVMFWYAPASWSSTNLGGAGPGDYARLFEAGAYTTNSSYGWWSLYVDPTGTRLFFSTQTNDLSGGISNYIAYPISWTTNFFHQIALTYAGTNATLLYVDGGLAASGPPLSVYPGPEVLTNGFWIGSDSNGLHQARGLFNSVATYDVPLDGGAILSLFNEQSIYYLINPLNVAMFRLSSAPAEPGAGYHDAYNAITGQGNLSQVGVDAGYVAGTNAFSVWITNLTATVLGGGAMNVTFTVAGGVPGAAYDVFANSVLSFGADGVPWTWEGQAQPGEICQLTLAGAADAFLILGVPRDDDFDGLTTAYEQLVSKTDPHNPDTDGDGISDADEILRGLNPLASDAAYPAAPAVQMCP